MVDVAYRVLYTLVLVVLACLIGLMLVRSVKGPRLTDRILSINMISTMVISSIAVLSLMLEEGYLTDVALIYGMLSFISVLIVAMVYIPAHPRRDKFFREGEKKVDDGTDTSIKLTTNKFTTNKFSKKGGSSR